MRRVAPMGELVRSRHPLGEQQNGQEGCARDACTD